MSHNSRRTYSDVAEDLETVEEVYRNFADSLEDFKFDFEFDIEYHIENEVISFNYSEKEGTRSINVARPDGVLMLEGVALRESPQGEQIAHLPVGPVSLDDLEYQLKELYSALEEPDNWKSLHYGLR